MVAVPKIVMAEISNVTPLCERQPVIIRPELATTILLEIVPADPLVIEGTNDSFGIVGATVADHDELKITECLRQYRPDGAAQNAAPVVGGDDDADRRPWRHLYGTDAEHLK